MGLKGMAMLGLFFYMTEGDPTKLVGFGGTVLVAFLAMLYINQEGLLYLNNAYTQWKTPQQNPEQFRHPGESPHNMPYKDIYFETRDGCRLHSWFISAPNDAVNPITIVYYHANAGNMGFRLPNLSEMYRRLQCNIFILSYRGYGNSTGNPSEEGLIIDGNSTMEYILLHAKELKINTSKIYLFGRSLGGAVAAQVAKNYEEQLAGVILENTFASINSMVDVLFPWLAFDFIKNKLLRMKWDTKSIISKIRVPLLFIGGTMDEVVPHIQMLDLYNCAKKSKLKYQTEINGGTHNDTWMKGGEVYWKSFTKFITETQK